jgi:hypothetical protein
MALAARMQSSQGRSPFTVQDIDVDKLNHPFWDATSPYDAEGEMDEFAFDTLEHIPNVDKHLLGLEKRT